jgi:hypothetical protein
MYKIYNYFIFIIIFLTLLPSLHLYNSSQSDGRLYYVSSNDDDENNDASEVDEGSSNDDDENNDASEVDISTFSPNNFFGSSSEEPSRDENDGGFRALDPIENEEEPIDLDPVGLDPIENEEEPRGLDPVNNEGTNLPGPATSAGLDPVDSDQSLDPVNTGNGTSAGLDPVNNGDSAGGTSEYLDSVNNEGTNNQGTSVGLDPIENQNPKDLDPVKGNKANSVGDSEQSSGKMAFASGPEEDIPTGETFQNREDPGFTHITKLIADDLKKMPIEEIKVYPWDELNDVDVERVVKYLSFDPEFLVKIISNTSEDGISKIQNSLSLKSFNEIITNIPPEHAQKIKEKFSG